VGEASPGVWTSLEEQLRERCCYIVPHYVRRPASGSSDEWMELLGYAKRASGVGWESKQDYYARMAGFVTLYAALLQQATVPHFTPPAEAMQTRPVTNPLGVAAAWRWLARLLNQKPHRISATILLAFLKPSAHALARAYPRQFPKLLRTIDSAYIPKIHALIDAADAPEEQAALSNFKTWLANALAELAARRPLKEPAEAEMPVFKEPDNTGDPGDDSW
jgi:nucleoporin GLE1